MAKMYILLSLLVINLIFTFQSVLAKEIELTYSQSGACRAHLVELSSDWETGYVVVPENWSEPSGEKIRVQYYVKKSDRNTGLQNPVAMINGGPSMSSFDRNYFKTLNERQGISLIYVDQRGTGCSTTYPEVNYVTAELKRLENWASLSIVYDYEAVRKKLLGDRKWKIFGQSYGGIVALRYLESSPSKISSLHINGVGDFNWRPVKTMKERVKKLLKVQVEFFSEPFVDNGVEYSATDIVSYFSGLKEKLTPDFCVGRNQEYCGPIILDIMYIMIGIKTHWGALRRWILVMYYYASHPEVDRTEFIKLFNNQFFPIERADERVQVAAGAISYIEITTGFNEFSVCEAFETIEAPISECRYSQYSNIQSNDRMSYQSLTPSKISIETVKQNAKSFNIPIYFSGGSLDSFSPPSSIQRAVEDFKPHSSLLIIDGEGHESFLNPVIIDQVVHK